MFIYINIFVTIYVCIAKNNSKKKKFETTGKSVAVHCTFPEKLKSLVEAELEEEDEAELTAKKNLKPGFAHIAKPVRKKEERRKLNGNLSVPKNICLQFYMYNAFESHQLDIYSDDDFCNFFWCNNKTKYY